MDDALSVAIQSTKTVAVEPLNPQERDILSVYRLVWEGMFFINDDYMPEPCLVESVEESGNGTTWTFTLRSNVMFSDGSSVTAADVVASAQAILDRAQTDVTSDRGYYRNLNYFISSIRAKDEKTVVIKPKSGRRGWGLLYALTFPVLPADQVGLANPLGSGPYRIERFDPQNQKIYLEANTHWWKNQPQVKHITFSMHDTPQHVMEAYETAQVDAAFTRSISAALYKSGTTSLALDYRTNQLDVLQMNHSNSKLASVNVRKAIRAALDIDRMATSVYMGMVERTDTPMPAGTWMYNDNLAQHFIHNIDYAKQLLEEDGWGDSNSDGVLDRLRENELVELKLTLYVYEEPDNNVRVAAANLIRDQLAQIGISVDVQTLTMAGMQEKLRAGSFQLALISYAIDAVPDPGYLLISGNDGNYGRYKSTAITERCNELRACMNQREYQDKLNEIQRIFAEDCPFVCLWYRAGVVMTRLMYTTVRDVRELELLRGIESFHP